MLFLKQEPKTKERRASLRMEAWQRERELPPFQQGSSGDGLSSAFNTRPPAMAFNPSVSAAAIDQTQGGGRTQQSRWWCRVNQVAEGRVLLVPAKLEGRLVMEGKNGHWQMQGGTSLNSSNWRKEVTEVMMRLTENEEGGEVWSSACCGGDCQGRRKEMVTDWEWGRRWRLRREGK